MASLEEAVNLRTQGKVAIITLNLPKKLNALTQDLYYRLSCLMREVAVKPEVFITVLTGTGHFFSAGADVTAARPGADSEDLRRQILKGFVSNNLEITQAFYTHPKILVTALNGPAIGLSAALIGFSDFVYAAPHAYLLTPFSSLGLVAEGGSSIGFVQRLGISKANEALIMSKRITCEELVHTGFVNKVFDVEKSDNKKFMKLVLQEIDDRLGDHLDLDAQAVAEVLGGLNRFVAGIPQEQFRKIASGEKKHKL